jgi:hypothetical protein
MKYNQPSLCLEPIHAFNVGGSVPRMVILMNDNQHRSACLELIRLCNRKSEGWVCILEQRSSPLKCYFASISDVSMLVYFKFGY